MFSSTGETPKKCTMPAHGITTLPEGMRLSDLLGFEAVHYMRSASGTLREH